MNDDNHTGPPGAGGPDEHAYSGEPGPFTDFGQFGYGRIDKRVLNQDTYWVDVAGRPHLLIDMPRYYLEDVRTFLLDASEEWWLVELLADASDVAALDTFDPTGPDAERARTKLKQLSDAGAQAWIAATPLMRRLDQLLATPKH